MGTIKVTRLIICLDLLRGVDLRRVRRRKRIIALGGCAEISALNFHYHHVTFRKLPPPVNANTISAGHYHANAGFASLRNILYPAHEGITFYISYIRDKLAEL